MAGFATYFHRYLYSCPSECFAVSRLQGNFTSAQVRSFILDFNNPFDRRLASICQAIFINSLSPWVVIACLIESYILRTLVDVSLNFFFFFFFLINFIGILLSYRSNKREVTRTKKKKKKKKLPKGSNERDVSTHARKLPTE